MTDCKEAAATYQTFVNMTILESMLEILQIIKINKNILIFQAIMNLIDKTEELNCLSKKQPE